MAIEPLGHAAHMSEIPPLCPSCETVMEERTAQRGENAGNRFWGCMGFPYCTGTMSLDRSERQLHDPEKAREWIERLGKRSSSSSSAAPRTSSRWDDGSAQRRDSTDTTGGYGTSMGDMGGGA